MRGVGRSPDGVWRAIKRWFSADETEPVKMGSERSFALVFASVFTIVALWPLVGGGRARLWAILLVAAFALLGRLRQIGADLDGPRPERALSVGLWRKFADSCKRILCDSCRRKRCVLSGR